MYELIFYKNSNGTGISTFLSNQEILNQYSYVISNNHYPIFFSFEDIKKYFFDSLLSNKILSLKIDKSFYQLEDIINTKSFLNTTQTYSLIQIIDLFGEKTNVWNPLSLKKFHLYLYYTNIGYVLLSSINKLPEVFMCKNAELTLITIKDSLY